MLAVSLDCLPVEIDDLALFGANNQLRVKAFLRISLLRFTRRKWFRAANERVRIRWFASDAASNPRGRRRFDREVHASIIAAVFNSSHEHLQQRFPVQIELRENRLVSGLVAQIPEQSIAVRSQSEQLVVAGVMRRNGVAGFVDL